MEPDLRLARARAALDRPFGLVTDRSLLGSGLGLVRDHFLSAAGSAIRGVYAINGFSFAGHGQNSGIAFIPMKEWKDRPGAENKAQAVIGRSCRAVAQRLGLRERLRGTVEEYGRGITVDTSRIEEMARGIDPSNPGAIEEAMRSGMFEQQTTPAQQAALARLETLTAQLQAQAARLDDQAASGAIKVALELRQPGPA